MGMSGNNELRSCSPASGDTYELSDEERDALALAAEGHDGKRETKVPA